MRALRKSKKQESKLVLEEIIGLTAKNANGLASNASKGDCVYLAGCVVVVYNVESGNQSHLMVSSRMPKPLSCVAVSDSNGRFIAAGELGHRPAVLVWDYASHVLLSELKVHQYGVACIAFSPDGKHLVSVGYPHDGYLCLWDWRSGKLVTKFKSTSSCSAISCISFSPDAHTFVTAGKKHLKIWTIGSCTRSYSNTGGGGPIMDGKSANLGSWKGSSFVSVISTTSTLVGGRERAKFFSIYALTDTGILCVLNSEFSIKTWVDLKVEKSFAVCVSKEFIACACSYGIVQLFAVGTLNYAGSVQYSASKEHHESKYMVSNGADKPLQHDPTLPDAIACQFSTSEKLVVVFANHSLYVWDLQDVNKVNRCCLLVSHSACIWDVKNLPCENMHSPALACIARGCCGGISFATCSMDGTIRLWDLELQPYAEKKQSSEANTKKQFDGSSLASEQVGSIHLVSAGIFERDIVESGVCSHGFRSMAVSLDGKYLASGDCQGNLHIYNLKTMDYTCIQDSHEAEILSLSFSSPTEINDGTVREVPEDKYLLASSGRDRLIHLYDVERGFELIKSLDDHSAAVTSAKLTADGHKIFSCSADRSLVFRDVDITNAGCIISRRHHQIASNGTVYDMAIDPETKIVVTVGQDKKINTFDISSGKLAKSFKQEGDFGEPIKVSMDPTSSFLVCSYSNKSICMYDFGNGELVAQAVGHSEVITGIIFLPDCQHIISVGGEGCIFVWKIPSLLSSRMLERLKEFGDSLLSTSMPKRVLSNECHLHAEFDHSLNANPQNSLRPGHPDQNCTGMATLDISEFRFSISRLPNWAQTKVATKENLPMHPESTSAQLEELESPSSSPTNEVVKCTVGSLCETHTPKEVPKGSFASGTNSSLGPREISSFAMDNRWLTIHTVCLDLLESPEVREVKDMKVLGSTSNLFGDSSLEGQTKGVGSTETTLGDPAMMSIPGPSYLVEDVKQDPKLKERDQCCHPGNSCENGELHSVYGAPPSEATTKQFDSDMAEALGQTTKSWDESNSTQDGDLFSQHFSNLSADIKLKGRNSSARRSYSARFFVRRNHLTDCRRIFETSNHTPADDSLNFCEEVPHISPEDPLMIPREEQEVSDSGIKDAEEFKLKDQTSASEDTAVQKTVDECTEAILSLDAAAERSLQLFSNLSRLISREEGAEIYEKAVDLLPSIMEKLNALACVVQSNNSSPRPNNENCSFEPILEKFADSLSSKVLELVKKSM